jgi:hypothetical protein
MRRAGEAELRAWFERWTFEHLDLLRDDDKYLIDGGCAWTWCCGTSACQPTSRRCAAGSVCPGIHKGCRASSGASGPPRPRPAGCSRPPRARVAEVFAADLDRFGYGFPAG